MESGYDNRQDGIMSVNMQPESNTYHVVCNYCDTETNFIHFNEFLEHARKEHGPNIALSAVKIVANEKKIHKKFKVERNLDDVDDCKTTSPTSPLASLPVYDLSRLKRQCLLELIQLLNKCLCIWHKPTRLRTTRKDRVHAYQLLLLKLREYQPQAVFRDVRSIVRQLITNFFCHQMSSPEQSGSQNCTQCESLLLNNPTCSRTVVEELMFLSSADVKDLTELDINKLCSFCSLGFYTFESLWLHMVNAHVLRPRDKAFAQSTSLQVVGMDNKNTESIPLKERHQRSRSRSRARGHSNSESERNDPTDNNMESRNLRKLSRKGKQIKMPDVETEEEDEEEDLLVDKDNEDNESDCYEVSFHSVETESDSESSNADKNPATYFLSDYNDKFLEEFIDIYKKHNCLWQKKSENYKNEQLCALAYEELLEKYRQDRDFTTASISKVKHLIRRMRDYYHRLNMPNANPYRSHIWQRLAFIDGTHRRRRQLTPGRSSLPDILPEFNCTQCAKRFKRAKYFACHQLRAHPPTECSVCSENFGNADDLHKHLLWFHRKDNNCPLCNASSADWQSAQHLAIHFYDHTCRRCGQIFHDAANFQRHKLKCCAKNRHKCWHCNAAFTSTMEIRKHSRAQHNDERPFKCSSCELTFKYLTPLLRHRKVHQRLESGSKTAHKIKPICL